MLLLVAGSVPEFFARRLLWKGYFAFAGCYSTKRFSKTVDAQEITLCILLCPFTIQSCCSEPSCNYHG
jgi:hypothetical protein